MLEELVSFGIEESDGKLTYTADKTFTGTKIMFYNGKYYYFEFKNGTMKTKKIKVLERVLKWHKFKGTREQILLSAYNAGYEYIEQYKQGINDFA